MNYETFKNESSKLKVFEEWVIESYNYNPSLINDWKIFKNSCELYVKCLNGGK